MESQKQGKRYIIWGLVDQLEVVLVQLGYMNSILILIFKSIIYYNVLINNVLLFKGCKLY